MMFRILIVGMILCVGCAKKVEIPDEEYKRSRAPDKYLGVAKLPEEMVNNPKKNLFTVESLKIGQSGWTTKWDVSVEDDNTAWISPGKKLYKMEKLNTDDYVVITRLEDGELGMEVFGTFWKFIGGFGHYGCVPITEIKINKKN